MLTILEVINLSSDYLAGKGVQESKRNAELLLCHVLSCKRINLYLNYDRPVGDTELANYRTLLKRRGAREPLQYLTGSVEFYGHQLKITPSVLIPRPETEILVERVITENSNRSIKILDIGTGSGNIAVALALHIPGAVITGMDKSAEALIVAAENAAINSCADKINFIEADVLKDDFLANHQGYDVIVSNPPYISEKEFDLLEPELRIHEPKTALSDMADGLVFYRRILQIAGQLLSKGGKVYLEMAQGQCSQIRELFTLSGLNNIKVIKDYQNIERVISGELQ